MRKIIPLLLAFALFGCEQSINLPIPITVEEAPALGPYSPAVIHGDVVYLSGIIAFDSKTKTFAAANIEDQFAQSMINLKTVLAASDSDLEHIIKITVFLKNPADFPALNIVYGEVFTDHKPARTTVPGVDWGRDDILIELDVIAARKPR